MTIVESSRHVETYRPADGFRGLAALFGIGADDHAPLEQARAVVTANLAELVQAFYNFVHGFPEFQRFLNPSIIPRLEETFRHYLLTLGMNVGSPEYADHRLRIGSSHERVGLSIKGYLAAYSHLQEIITRAIFHHCSAEEERGAMIWAINKVIMLDVCLAVESYHRTALTRIEQLMHQLEEEKELIRHLAETDHLTNLMNRRAFFECLDAEIQRCQRYGNALCVLMLDLDNFKTVNDSYGHQVGDLVLRSFGNTLRQCSRQLDKCGRLGGEEFGVIMVETELESAQSMAERLRLAVSKAEIVATQTRLVVTVSGGVAQWDPGMASASELLKHADAALYAAKEAGKNCICVATGFHTFQSQPPSLKVELSNICAD